MNTKRQTVWLVSMLSLMVILSAYYLFTEDADPTSDLLTENAGQQVQVEPDATEAAGNESGLDGITVDEVTTGAGGTVETGKAEGKEDPAAAGKSDEEVLKQLEAQGASAGIFNELQEKRDQQFYEENNRLYGIISDTKQNSEEAGKAVEQLNRLEDKSAQITGIEEELQKQYSNALVSEENNKYKVVVQSEKLERSQADSILLMVVKELGVSPEQVSVQFIP